MTRQEQLTLIVAECFRDVSFPRDEDIFDGYDPDIPKFLAVIEHRRTWQSILSILSNADISMALLYADVCYWMTPEALHSFAPAYLTIAMTDRFECAMPFFAVTTPPFYKVKRTFALFTNPQKRAYALVREYQSQLFKQGSEAKGYRMWSKWLHLS